MPPSRQNSPWIGAHPGEWRFLDVIRRRGHGTVAANVEVRRDVRGGAKAEKRVESAIHRAAGQGLVVAILPEAEMPLPHHRGAIALIDLSSDAMVICPSSINGCLATARCRCGTDSVRS
jgi:hypothetical protein